eukprot:gene6281-biopygen6257
MAASREQKPNPTPAPPPPSRSEDSRTHHHLSTPQSTPQQRLAPGGRHAGREVLQHGVDELGEHAVALRPQSAKRRPRVGDAFVVGAVIVQYGVASGEESWPGLSENLARPVQDVFQPRKVAGGNRADSSEDRDMGLLPGNREDGLKLQADTLALVTVAPRYPRQPLVPLVDEVLRDVLHVPLRAPSAVVHDDVAQRPPHHLVRAGRLVHPTVNMQPVVGPTCLLGRESWGIRFRDPPTGLDQSLEKLHGSDTCTVFLNISDHCRIVESS